MATGAQVTAQGGSGWDVVLGGARDTFSAYIDIIKNRENVTLQERMNRTGAQQHDVLYTTPLPYQENAQPLNVRSAPTQPVTVAFPSWIGWAAGGVGLLAGGLLLKKILK